MTPATLSVTLDCMIKRNIRLNRLSRWRIGGPADYFSEPRTSSELAELLSFCRNEKLPFVIIGDCTNMLFDDAGYRGMVIHVGRNFNSYTSSADGTVTAGAGMWVPTFVRRLIHDGLSGAEHAIGIPGTLGGLIVMNGGSRRLSISENVLSVDAMDCDGRTLRLSKDDLGFAYRHSMLQQRNLVVLSATFRFTGGDRAEMRRQAIGILAERRQKFPANKANCGSVFASDPAHYERIGPPGLAIERLGLKGLTAGGAQISTDHANFIVNKGKARSKDILRLINVAQTEVERATGVRMRVEIRYLPPEGTGDQNGRNTDGDQISCQANASSSPSIAKEGLRS